LVQCLPRTGNLGGKFLEKPKLILGCSADYDDESLMGKLRPSASKNISLERGTRGPADTKSRSNHSYETQIEFIQI